MIQNECILEPLLHTKEHAKVLEKWRLEPYVVEMSFHQNLKPGDPFFEYFQCYFIAKDLPSIFIRYNNERIGFIGFTPYIHRESPHRKSAEISILLAPDFRGKGFGSKALEAACSYGLQQGYEDFYAKIKPQNTPSLALFEKHGFVYLGERCEIVEQWEVLDHIPCKLFCKELTAKTAQKQVFIVAEAGSNWRLGTPKRDRQMAKTLIDVAVEAGCDAVKFQTFKAETVYAPNAGFCDYLETDEDIHTIFEDLAMPYEMLVDLHDMCQKAAIAFMSTPFSIADFNAVDPLVTRHKIASYELSHIRLLACAAKSQKPLYLSTGASTLDDIAWAVAYYKKCGGRELTLLQCTAQYPAKDAAMNIKAIQTLRQHFQLPVGLSDHSPHPTSAPVAAVALGASYIEKHYTLDRRLVGPDHSFSIEPSELKEMVDAIRHTEKMLGTGIKEVQEEEKELFLFATRHIQALCEIKKGEMLQEGDNIAILRPGKQRGGVHPKYIETICGKKASRSIQAGEGISYGDWQ